MKSIRPILCMLATAALIIAALTVPVGCTNDRAANLAQYDAAMKAASDAEAVAKAALASQRAALEAKFSSEKSELTREVENLKEAIRQPESEAERVAIAKAIAAIEKSQEKLQAKWDEQAAKLDKANDELIAKAGEVKAALEAHKEKLTSEDPGERLAAGAAAISPFIPGQTGVYVGLIGTAVGGFISALYQARQKNSVKSAAIEAIGTMSQAITSGLIPMDDNAAKVLNSAQSQAAKDLVDEADKAYSDTIKISEAMAARLPANKAA